MVKFRRSVFGFLLGIVPMALPLSGFAEASEDLTILVPLGKGGALDKMARHAAQYLPSVGDYHVTVENRLIKGESDGYRDFLARPADGSTILAWFEPAAARYGHGFDLNDLAIINVQEIEPPILAARSEFGWKNLEEFVAVARQSPGKYSIGASRAGGSLLLIRRQFQELGINIREIDYASGGKAREGITKGEIDLTVGSLKALRRLGDRITPLAVMAPRRLRLWREVPSINEAMKFTDAKPIFGASYRFFAVHRQVLDRHPEAFKKLSNAFEKLNFESEGFRSRYGGSAHWFGHLESQGLVARAHSHFIDLRQSMVRPSSAPRD